MEEITNQIKVIVKDLFGIDAELTLGRPDEQFGDYSTNVAMQLAGSLNKNPREIAEAIAENLKENPVVKEVSVAGPGFINLTINDDLLLSQLNQGFAKPYAGQKVVIETNNPNPFKDIHIGHTMNAIVADTLANLLEVGGAEVHRVSYHGDVGLHVAKSLWAIMDEFGVDAPTQMASIPEDERPKHLRDWYARGAGLYEEDPLVKEAIEQLIPQTFSLEDPVIRNIYEIGKEWSFSYFKQVLTSLGSKPVEKLYFESDTDKEGRRIVEENIGTVFEKSDGAIIFPGERYDLHTRVFIASRGTTLYEARDLGLMALKNRDFSPHASYIVTAEEQREYFKVVLKAAELSDPSLVGKTVNIPTGMIKLTTGKMSSRKGTAINISWLFEVLREAVIKRGAAEDTVEASVLGALRYTMLKNKLTSDTVFDVEQSVALEGNTGPYLQYAHARACSIIAKAEGGSDNAMLLEAGERSLLRKMSEFSDVVNLAAAELMPHHICTYLFELSQAFNSFYEHNRVIGDPRQSTRLKLVEQYANILKGGLQILGIAAPEHM